MPIPVSNLTLACSSNVETEGLAVTVGEYATIAVVIQVPEGTTHSPNVMVTVPTATIAGEGVLNIMSASLKALPPNMNVTGFATSISTFNNTYNDSVRFTIESVVNMPDNLLNENDTVVLEIVALVVNHPNNVANTDILVKSVFLHSTDAGVVILETTNEMTLFVVEPKLEVVIELNSTRGDAGDGVRGSVYIYHTAASTAVAYDVNVTALLAPYIVILPSTITFTDASAQSSVVSLPGWDGLMHLPVLLLDTSVNITFDSYVDMSVLASIVVPTNASLHYLTSPNTVARNLYPYNLFLFSYFYGLFDMLQFTCSTGIVYSGPCSLL